MIRILLAFLAVCAPVAAVADEVWFSGETTRYKHLVLGKPFNWTTLNVRPLDGDAISLTLPAMKVFEDTRPRLADFTGDGVPEIVVVQSGAEAGAALAIYEIGRKELRKLASTPPIGRSNRWLAPAGIADFNRDGVLDIAYVETPHIGGTLRIWTLAEDGLTEIASARGFSNHRIGEPFITGGVRDCGSGPEIVTLDDNWDRVLLSRVEGDMIAVVDHGPFTSRESIDAALACSGTG